MRISETFLGLRAIERLMALRFLKPIRSLASRFLDSRSAGPRSDDNTASAAESRKALFVDWYQSFSDFGKKYAFVVFSKDRPMQLHALLTSFRAASRESYGITVLYHASSEDFWNSYNECMQIFSRFHEIRFVRQRSESSFQSDLYGILEEHNESRVGFLVDDIVFIREFDLRAFDNLDLRTCIPSLRLGRNIGYSYTTKKKFLLPSTMTTQSGLLSWRWQGSDGDWAYPLSLDGNIFLRSEIIPILKRLHCTSPNTLEAQMQQYNDVYLKRYGACFERPRLINIASNVVQKDYPNRHGNISAEFLLKKWKEGKAIDVQELSEIDADSVHIEHQFSFLQRML
jgi:hypothetical protein